MSTAPPNSVAPEHRPRILVVGDVMIDVAWVVSEQASPTAQSHGDVAPRRRVDPSGETERLGGAGCTALALAGSGCSVYCLGSWNPRDQDRLDALRPGGDLDSGQEFRLMRAGAAAGSRQVTTTKFRVYVQRGGRVPRLEYRFDQDPVSDCSGIDLASDMPESVDAVVVMDFNKRFVSAELIASIDAMYPHRSWFIDSKSRKVADLVLSLATGHVRVLTMNRDEFTALAKEIRARYAPPGGTDDQGGDRIPTGRERLLPRHRVELELATFRTLALVKDHISAELVIAKLDRDGAAAFYRRRDDGTLFTSSVDDTMGNATGISAGDVFMAQLVVDCLAEGKGRPEDLLDSAQSAAEGWIRYAELDRNHTPYNAIPSPYSYLKHRSLSTPPPSRGRATAPVGRSLAQIQADYDACFVLDRVLTADEIDINRAKRVLGNIICADPVRRTEIRQFAARVLAYFDNPQVDRPLSCLVIAEPGSGKTMFSKELARQVGAQLFEVNASQMATRNDLLNAIADMTSLDVDAPRPILVLDEVDTKIDGEHIFGLLLSPMWDAQVRVFPRRYFLPRRMTILAISSTALATLHDGHAPKFADFESRLNGGTLELTLPSPVDCVYLTAALLIRLQPSVRQVERGLFQVMANATGVTARTIEAFVAGLTTSLDGVLRRGDCEGVTLPAGGSWRHWHDNALMTLRDSAEAYR